MPTTVDRQRDSIEPTGTKGGKKLHDASGKTKGPESHSKPLYSVFTRHERYCIVAMSAVAGMFR